MTGEVHKKNEVKTASTFSELEIGEGIESFDGVRIKIGLLTYLHFRSDGRIECTYKDCWPDRAPFTVREFKLIAEEI